jgi:hypothetical protein
MIITDIKDNAVGWQVRLPKDHDYTQKLFDDVSCLVCDAVMMLSRMEHFKAFETVPKQLTKAIRKEVKILDKEPFAYTEHRPTCQSQTKKWK